MTIEVYNMKAIVCGNVIEFYRYEDTMFRGFERKRSNFSFCESPEVDYETGEILVSDKKSESRARSNIRARNQVRRLALSNFTSNSKFLTLTFKENLTDVSQANELFKEFIKKVRKKHDKNLKYLAVVEFQKRGAVHYHMLCDLKYIGVDKLAKLWGHGGITIKKIKHVDNVGAYIVKYMTKQTVDERMFSKKMYQCSRNLERPKELVGNKAEWLYERMRDEKRKKVYSSQYENKQTSNQIIYEEYNLTRK